MWYGWNRVCLLPTIMVESGPGFSLKYPKNPKVHTHTHADGRCFKVYEQTRGASAALRAKIFQKLSLALFRKNVPENWQCAKKMVHVLLGGLSDHFLHWDCMARFVQKARSVSRCPLCSRPVTANNPNVTQ